MISWPPPLDTIIGNEDEVVVPNYFELATKNAHNRNTQNIDTQK